MEPSVEPSTESLIAEKMDKRRRILEATLKLFHQKGYSPVTLEEIAHEAGLAKGTLYLYFRDKEDLFASAVRHVLQVNEEALLAATTEGGDPFQILEKAALAHLETYTRNRDFFGLFFILTNPSLVSNREELFRQVVRSQGKLLNRLAGVLSEAQRRGLIRPGFDPRELASLFGGMVNSAVHRLHRLGYPPPTGTAGTLDIPRTVHGIIEVFCNGVAVKPAARLEKK